MTAINTAAATVTTMSYREYITRAYLAALREYEFEGGCPVEWYRLEEISDLGMYNTVEAVFPGEYLPPMSNLTPHEIRVRPNEWTEVVFPVSGELARVEVEHEVVNAKLNISRRKTGKVTGIPSGVMPFPIRVLVSSMVLDAWTPEVGVVCYAPDTGASAIRNEKGHIVAVTGLVIKEADVSEEKWNWTLEGVELAGDPKLAERSAELKKDLAEGKAFCWGPAEK